LLCGPGAKPTDPARSCSSLDLLLLDAHDMAQLRRSPEVAAIVEQYVAAGGALFAFVAEAGDYREIVGAPLVIEAASKPTDRFNLAPGEVTGVVPRFDKKKVDVKSKRTLPELSKLSSRGPWRVIAFTQGQKGPRIIERDGRREGGYVVLWLDDSASFRGRQGGTVPKVEETRRNLEARGPGLGALPHVPPVRQDRRAAPPSGGRFAVKRRRQRSARTFI